LGVAIGIGGALALTRLLRTLLSEWRPKMRLPRHGSVVLIIVAAAGLL